MNRYHITFLVRGDNGDEWDAAERQLNIRVTAADELQARRKTLENAWWNRLLVSRFITVKQVRSNV
jgi:hypothetical protein